MATLNVTRTDGSTVTLTRADDWDFVFGTPAEDSDVSPASNTRRRNNALNEIAGLFQRRVYRQLATNDEGEDEVVGTYESEVTEYLWGWDESGNYVAIPARSIAYAAFSE